MIIDSVTSWQNESIDPNCHPISDVAQYHLRLTVKWAFNIVLHCSQTCELI